MASGNVGPSFRGVVYGPLTSFSSQKQCKVRAPRAPRGPLLYFLETIYLLAAAAVGGVVVAVAAGVAMLLLLLLLLLCCCWGSPQGDPQGPLQEAPRGPFRGPPGAPFSCYVCLFRGGETETAEYFFLCSYAAMVQQE